AMLQALTHKHKLFVGLRRFVSSCFVPLLAHLVRTRLTLDVCSMNRETVLFAVDFLGFGEADVEGEEGDGVGKFVAQGAGVAELMDGGGASVPEIPGQFDELHGIWIVPDLEGFAVVVDS